MNQRKRKLDSIPDAGHKRSRLEEAKIPTARQDPHSSRLKQATPNMVASIDGQSGGRRPRRIEADSSAIDQDEEPHSEFDSSESELSSDTDMSSDSGISSSDSDDGRQDQDSEHGAHSGHLISGRDLPGAGMNLIALPAQSKPVISSSTTISAASGLQSRIAAFLPRLRKANEDLLNAVDDHRIDAVTDDQDHYIEMDLGLGVLKEKPRRRPLDEEIRTRESSGSSSSSSSSSASNCRSGDNELDANSSRQDTMRVLLGKKDGRQGRPNIQALEET